MNRYRVYFEDEAPRIGAGWRPVEATVGYKWVKLKTPGADRGTKIKRSVWDNLRKDESYVHQEKGLAHHQR